MNMNLFIKSIAVILTTSFITSLAQATKTVGNERGYQEVSYDDLLNELSQKKAALIPEEKSALDTVKIHAGLGYANSFSNFRVNNENISRFQTGLQLSLGIDLFSPNWYSEGIFRNYGVTSEGSEDISLKEFDLKLGYQDSLTPIWSYSFGTGLANRFLKISNPSRGVSIEDTTPSLMMSGGIFAHPNKNISVGVELNARTPFVSSTADKNSYDFALRLTTSL